MMSCFKSLRPANRIWSRLLLCQTRGYVERDPKTIKMGNLVFEPEYKRNMPDDGKTPFANLNKMLNVVEADYDKESLKQLMQRKIDVNDIAAQRVDEKTKEKIGKDLAAAYVVVKSGGRIQFAGMDRWIEKKGNHIPLPNYNIPNLKLQVADLTASEIRYEGLAFLEGTSIKMLILTGCKYIDDFCLSRLYKISDTLEFLDISGCFSVTDNGLGALYKLRNLKCLRINNLPNVGNKALVTAFLLNENPELNVLGVDLPLDHDEEMPKTSPEESGQYSDSSTNCTHSSDKPPTESSSGKSS